MLIHATALTADQIHHIAHAGCDLVCLTADAADWPRHWYERLGFVDVGARWALRRPA